LIFPDFAQNSTAPSLPRQVPELFNVRGEAIARPEFFQLRTQRSVGRLGSHGKTMGKPWENHGKTYGKPMENLWTCLEKISMKYHMMFWLVVWNMFFFHSVGNVIIPTDEVHHFSEG
jgi:hypothetical protein